MEEAEVPLIQRHAGSRIAALLTVAALAALTASSAAPAAVTVGTSGWSWANPLPQGNDLHAIDFSGARGYAVGAAGTALRSDDGGATWRGLPTGSGLDLSALQIVDPETIVVTGGDGCLVRLSRNGGATFAKVFQVQETRCDEPVGAVSFVSPAIGYLVLRSGALLRTDDSGDTFGRRTALPGTAASSGGGSAVPTALRFRDADHGIAFTTVGGATQGYTTENGGQTWKPLAGLPAGLVADVWFLDANVGYAWGAKTLWRSGDGGATWAPRALGDQGTITSLRCSSADACSLTVDEGDRLLRTADGGASAGQVTVANAPLDAVAYAGPQRVVAVGGGGATVASDDGGANYVRLDSDIEGTYGLLRRGPTGDIVAPGFGGSLARSTDGGRSWRTQQTSTTTTIVDATFSNAQVGYALDARGGLQRTLNAGATWKRLDPGTVVAPRRVAAVGSSVVLLVGPRGVLRASGLNGRFAAAGGRAVRGASLDGVDVVGSTVVVWRRGAAQILRSTDAGRSFTRIRAPAALGRRPRVAQVDLVSAGTMWLVDTSGRVFTTRSSGRSWTESLGTGRAVSSVSFVSATQGFASVGAVGDDRSTGYVLRTSDGGRTWRPQPVAPGSIRAGGVVAATARDAAALIGGTIPRRLFFTAVGGDAGKASKLTLTGPKARFGSREFARLRGRLRITGRLAGAGGGERIIVSAREIGSATWRQVEVIAGANGGSFTAQVSGIRRSAVVVAQFPGDSGRNAAGATRRIIVSRR